MWEQAKVIFLRSLERVALGVAQILPGLLAMALIVLLSLVAALAVRGLLNRALSGLALDRRLREWGLGPPASGGAERPWSAAALVARVGAWTVLVAGVLTSLAVFESTSALGLRLLAFLPQVLIALAILAVGLVLARYLERSVLITAVNMEIQAARLLAVGVKVLVMVLSAAMALEHLDIGGVLVTLSFGILFGGIVLALALAIGLGSREAVSRSWEKRLRRREERETQDDLHDV